ncbi:putative arabinogalactan protein/22/41 [Dioscorea sansibarensis]
MDSISLHALVVLGISLLMFTKGSHAQEYSLSSLRTSSSLATYAKTIDQGIGYVLMLAALIITYLIH